MIPVQLNRPLLLEAAVTVPDSSGGFVRHWQAITRHWAEVVMTSGKLTSGNTGQIARSRFRITIRARPEGALDRPRPGQRFRDGRRLLVIQSVGERDPARRYLLCLATEETAP